MKKQKKYILLDSIRSCQNVGAIMRTCDGSGFDRVILTGFSPYPPRRDISKTAIGAENHIEWEYHEEASETILELKNRGFRIVALEQTSSSIDFRTLEKTDDDLCLIVGNEIEGVAPSLIRLADIAVEIPMLGTKKSLNVATSAGILMYHML